MLIESPGGRGKSALLRETVREGLEAFAKDPRAPLPVLCEGDGDTLFDRAKRSLGTQGFSDDLLRALTRAGEFFFVVDGLTESSVTPQMLRLHTAEYDAKCPLLLSSRPNEAYRHAVEAMTAWAIVEPERLTEETLPSFLAAYQAKPDALTDAAKEVCRDAEGTYLPILVRLALLITEENPHSVSDIYRDATWLMLKKDGKLKDDAIQLCLDTYWQDGQRYLAYANAPQERKRVLRALLDAGLVVPAELSLLGSEEPRTVRFFHDSIQSYLTAVGLSRREDWPDALSQAAGEERFTRDHADLLTGGIPELFQMLILVYDPQDSIRRTMYERVCDYAQRFGSAFSLDWVVEASALSNLSSAMGSDAAGGTALSLAAEQCREVADIRCLGGLYSKATRFLWPKLKAAETDGRG